MSPDLSSLTPLANHLWQSTIFVGVIWLITLGLKRNRAAVRYWLWFTASVKFLLPFSFLVALGRELSWRTAAPLARPQWSFVVDNAIQPFIASTTPTQVLVPPYGSLALTPIFIVVWFCGIAFGLAFWLKCWMQMRRIRKSAVPLPLDLPIPGLSSPSQIEPGVFGIFRPVLLLPQGIESRLAPAQLDAIVAHEMAHVRRHDNLTAATHMLVETVFWFFPVVWWLRARLIEERENACDEAVISMGNEAESYAAGIIEVCKSYAESPTTCISGISGSDLKKRVICIVNRHLGENLTRGKKVALAIVSVAVVAAPLVIGLLNAPLHAQSPDIQSSLVAAQSPKSNDSAPFEAVSVKVRKAEGPSEETLAHPGGYVTLTNVTVRQLIEKAFLPYNTGWSPDLNFLLSGNLPEWAKSERFDIAARATDDPTIAQKQLMLRLMLADRFKLTMHHETRELPVFALVLVKPGRTGAQLAAHRDNTCVDSSNPVQTSATGSFPCGMFFIRNGPRDRPGVFIPEARGVTMHWFAQNLSALVNRLVVDRTGLNGTFDLKFEYSPEPGQLGAPRSNSDAAMASTPAATIFTALQEQLGLKLESQIAPVDIVVIDHIEGPTPN